MYLHDDAGGGGDDAAYIVHPTYYILHPTSYILHPPCTSMMTPVAEGMMQPPKKRVKQIRVTTVGKACAPGVTKHEEKAALAASTPKMEQTL